MRKYGLWYLALPFFVAVLGIYYGLNKDEEKFKIFQGPSLEKTIEAVSDDPPQVLNTEKGTKSTNPLEDTNTPIQKVAITPPLETIAANAKGVTYDLNPADEIARSYQTWLSEVQGQLYEVGGKSISAVQGISKLASVNLDVEHKGIKYHLTNESYKESPDKPKNSSADGEIIVKYPSEFYLLGETEDDVYIMSMNNGVLEMHGIVKDVTIPVYAELINGNQTNTNLDRSDITNRISDFRVEYSGVRTVGDTELVVVKLSCTVYDNREVKTGIAIDPKGKVFRIE